MTLSSSLGVQASGSQLLAGGTLADSLLEKSAPLNGRDVFVTLN